MSLNKRHSIVNEIICVLGAGVVLLLFPLSLHSALTSTNFTIESPTIGSAGSAGMSSTNYSISSGKGRTYTTSGVDVEEDEDDENDNSQGSKNHVKKKPNVQPIISATIDTTNVSDGKNQQWNSSALTYANTGTQPVESKDKELEVKQNDTREAKSTSTNLKKSPLLASLISGDFEQVLAGLDDVYTRLFTHFFARAIFFVWVLAFLYFIRVNTRIGRKYSPF